MADQIDYIKAMSVLTVEPGDVLVVNVDFVPSRDTEAAIINHIRSVIPDATVLVLSNGVQLGVMRQAA